jgi:hypothetical protein
MLFYALALVICHIANFCLHQDQLSETAGGENWVTLNEICYTNMGPILNDYEAIFENLGNAMKMSDRRK